MKRARGYVFCRRFFLFVFVFARAGFSVRSCLRTSCVRFLYRGATNSFLQELGNKFLDLNSLQLALKLASLPRSF
ncbi:MAG: hypothetical protein EBR09_11330 [Proteobacteria bacterium]|nr:hypothetical protein [Pseudomonadota bacterium]